MLGKTFANNKKIYLAYNNFRKKIFTELSPKDGHTILYKLPWMLSVNVPEVPGFVPKLKKEITIHGATTDKALLSEEPSLKTSFNIKKSGSLLVQSSQPSLIHGLYTIGSVGTISQTALSDCDIWICIEKTKLEDVVYWQLRQKVNLIKDWLDTNLKMPVYFFICDIEDIRDGNFGVLGSESSGSAQRNVLKEEFFRTTITISGKIPLWWVCFDSNEDVDYQNFAAQYAKDVFSDYDFIDMGTVNAVDTEEYFGAALWQFNKALTRPLKSLLKMLQLEMHLGAPHEELLCHRFRRLILHQDRGINFIDPSIFTLQAILHYHGENDPDNYDFIEQCCYLRYDIKFYSKKITLKEKLAKDTFKLYRTKMEQIYRLNDFDAWPLLEQLEFGKKIFAVLLNIYKRIIACRKSGEHGLTSRDMTIIGRKLAAYLEIKNGKIPVVHKPMLNLNPTNLTFNSDAKIWQVSVAGDANRSLVTGDDLVYCIAYLVWNDLYLSSNVRMAPNATPITLQEINNLAKRIKEIFGVFDITNIDYDNFLEKEKIVKMLIILSCGETRQMTEMRNFNVIYSNHWGELFSRYFNTQDNFKEFIESGGRKFSQTDRYFYIQRSNLYYEKNIDRAKDLINKLFSSVTVRLSN